MINKTNNRFFFVLEWLPRLPSKNQGRVNLYGFKPLWSNSFPSVPISCRYFPVCGSIRGSRSAEVAKYMVSVSTQVYKSPSCHRYSLLRSDPGTRNSVFIHVHITPSWSRYKLLRAEPEYKLIRLNPGTIFSVLIQVHIIPSWSMYTVFCLDPGTHYFVFIQVHITPSWSRYTLLRPDSGTSYSVLNQVLLIFLYMLFLLLVFDIVKKNK